LISDLNFFNFGALPKFLHYITFYKRYRYHDKRTIMLLIEVSVILLADIIYSRPALHGLES